MQFLTTDDLTARIHGRLLDESILDGADVLDIIEGQNISLFTSKLNARYDTDALFSQTGEDRHPLIVKYLTVFVLYDVIRRNAARKVPIDLVELRKEAMAWLDAVRDGVEHPTGLPLSETGGENDVLYGNNKNLDFYL